MSERPALTDTLDTETFRSFYYLKAELVDFCRAKGLPVSGGKLELTERIACYLENGRVLRPAAKPKKAPSIGAISEETEIEPNFVCSEKHRAFFKEKLGKGFTFNVGFQRWLKANAGKTYGEAVTAYRQILEEKKHGKTAIDRQFEYNAYIRDFYGDNAGRALEEAILCWNYKKSLPGHNRYERADLAALGQAYEK